MHGGCAKLPHQSEVHPRDSELLDGFSLARPHLEAIVGIFESCPEVQSLTERGFLRGHPNEKTPIACAIPDPYRYEYAEILRQIGVRGVFRRADGDIGFYVSEQPDVIPMAMKVSGKGYEYMKRSRWPEANLLDTIDCHGNGAFHVRRIDGGWHLFLYCYS